ncbi:outer membrane protein assembly factor BamA [Luteithermobacter gelatinilyticus]|uniref:outer membrane protein assembly factor BamA n=1 Tax=Luteithermobacter gelatinilyticus TaxID=2582913 RepID=UPI00143DF0D6|nr:outer membrane protein assembly factor BamA [Luteithermobacter gelatinilyticus]
MKNRFFITLGFVCSLTFSFLGPVSGGLAQTGAYGDAIQSIQVVGNQRIEAETIKSYLIVSEGEDYDEQKVDISLKRLFNTGLFSDVKIGRAGNTLVVEVVENPIINRIAFEGNKYKKDDKLYEEIQLRPRIVFSRAKVRADVQRLLEVYRRGGRFAATIEPKVIQLDQNRVNLVFEISEGPKSKIGKINFMGNKAFNNDDLRGVMATKESRWWKFLTSEDTYDPDRLAYDKQLLRDFYRSKGYADFRITSAVAELARDKEHFFINITVEEGEVYSFGKITVDSRIPDLKSELLEPLVVTREGNIYNSSQIDRTVELLTDVAGLKGYAFVDVRPRVRRNRKERTVDITYVVNKAPRVYVERINITGNVRTHDKVIRREMRLVEGDAYNSAKVKRSEIRIKSLGFFKEATIEQVEGSAPDKTILEVTVEEQATGELSVGAGFSSSENFLFDFSIGERNFMGKGQSLRLGTRISSFRKEVDISFTEPYFMDRAVVAGVDLFVRDTDFLEADFTQQTYGASLRTAFPVTEYIVMSSRYTFRRDKVETTFISSSPYLESNRGDFTTSSIGYGLSYDTLDNRQHPSRGQRLVFNQDFAGLGGNTKYLRSRASYDFYHPFFGNWVFNVGVEGGNVFGISDDVRLSDRFFLGTPKMRGFERGGVGPRDSITRDALGGNTYYTGSIELFVPLGAGAREMGIEASAFVDAGALFGIDEPPSLVNAATGLTHQVIGDSVSPRVSAGIGFSWMSPFGPFRIDFAKALLKDEADKTEFFQFNIGTRF